MNNCEIEDCLEECGTKERAEFKLRYEDAMLRGDLEAAYDALRAATERGVIGGIEGYEYHQRIVDAQMDKHLALSN